MSKQMVRALAWAVLILVLCLIPGKDLPQWDWFSLFDLDKLVHAGMFFVLTLLLANAFRVKGSPARYLLWAVLVSILYGVATEIMQGLEAMGRRTDLGDMLANSIGALAAAWFAHWSLRKGRNFIPLTFLR